HEGDRSEVAGGGLGHFLEEGHRGGVGEGEGAGEVRGALANPVGDVREDDGPHAVALELPRRALGRVNGEVGGGGQGEVGPVGLGGAEGYKCDGLLVFGGLLHFGPGHLGQYDVFRHNTCTRATD